MENNNVYIRNMEAVDIYKHMNEGKGIYSDYTGMVAYSLELIKLKSVGFKIRPYKGYGKNISNDIINVKFNVGYKKDDKMVLTKEQLREELYINGFTLYDEEYVMYKRSGAKSRIGNCLFIKKKLYNKMIKWSRMGIKFPKDKELDVVGLGAYSSLVTSAIEDIITIDPDSILIINDVESNFKIKAKEIMKGEDGFLHSYLNENADITSCFTDGSCLIDESLFTGIHKDKSMMLLRNHMFKSAGFNTKIQKFYREYFKDEYDTAEIIDMFGNKIKAKDVRLICTPNSLKAFKFSKFVSDGTDKGMFEYWKQKVREDNNMFGVCKHEKQTKHIFNNTNYNQMSYQMINCLPINKEEIKDLCSFEIDYIDKLKNDPETFINYLYKEQNFMNKNEMMADIQNINNDFIYTNIFKKFRRETINSYVNKIKSGKVKIVADYCTLVSNPYEYLLSSVGEYSKNNLILKDNEVWTSLYKDKEDLVLFRNPNTSQSNVFLAKNKYNEVFDKYFNFTDNIIVVNSVECEICDILSGCDWDSDTAFVSNNKTLVKCAERCFRKYNVCLNKISSSKNKYMLNNKSMADIDNKLAESKNTIGEVVNLGQIAMSTYWNDLNNNENDNLNNLLEVVDVMTILSGVAIDNAKKSYDLDMRKEIDNIKSLEFMPIKKPLFWKYVSEDKNINKKIIKFNTPMDLLIEIIDENTQKADKTKTISLSDLLVPYSQRHTNTKQINKLIEEIDLLSDNINCIMSTLQGKSKEDKQAEYDKIEDLIYEEQLKIKNRKIKQETMYTILKMISEDNDKIKNIKSNLMKMLYKAQKEIFLNAFIHSVLE